MGKGKKAHQRFNAQSWNVARVFISVNKFESKSWRSNVKEFRFNFQSPSILKRWRIKDLVEKSHRTKCSADSALVSRKLMKGMFWFELKSLIKIICLANCGLGFSERKVLWRYEVTHEFSSTLRRSFECFECKESFISNYARKSHYAKHEKLWRFLCDICSKVKTETSKHYKLPLKPSITEIL